MCVIVMTLIVADDPPALELAPELAPELAQPAINIAAAIKPATPTFTDLNSIIAWTPSVPGVSRDAAVH
jgi:hypothetical protein